MEIAITEGIKVSVLTEFQDFFSDPKNQQFAFSYTIKIENNSEYTYKLISRHWYIFDSIGVSHEVEGKGVVGRQPTIEPGDFHEYMSGCNFSSAIGQMHGYYTMQRIMDGKKIKVEIPKFLMVYKPILN